MIEKRSTLGTDERFFHTHTHTGTRFQVLAVKEKKETCCYEKRLSTSRYEFRRLAFNEAPLPGQGSDSPRGAEDPGPGGGQVEKPDAGKSHLVDRPHG